jgi:hypothetical protein
MRVCAVSRAVLVTDLSCRLAHYSVDTFGFELNHISQENIVAIATFRVKGQIPIACAQVLQFNRTLNRMEFH